LKGGKFLKNKASRRRRELEYEKPAKVVIKIISVKGTCEAKHEVGQEFDLSRDFILGYERHPNTICPAALFAAYPNYRVLRFGGSLPWEEDEDVAHVACPDPFNPVVIQLKRQKE
jgi:uncharacterized repeat protein (TIGR04076 family)